MLEFYTQTAAVEISLSDFAVMAASLANGGTCPLTAERVFSEADVVKSALSQMLTSGMNTYSGRWAFTVGVPAKSAASGVIIMVIPNLLGMAVWSPPLD